MHGQLVLIAGLPGCGKTTYLGRMSREGWKVFDDFKAQSIGDCPKFRNSPKLDPLLAALREGLKCIVADIDFCDVEARRDAESILLSALPELNPSWQFFASDREACEANVRNRNRGSVRHELDLIAKYAPSYQIPRGAVVLPVWTNRQLATGN